MSGLLTLLFPSLLGLVLLMHGSNALFLSIFIGLIRKCNTRQTKDCTDGSPAFVLNYNKVYKMQLILSYFKF